MVGIEAGIEMLKVDKGAQEETGTGEENEGEGDFRSDQNVAEASASSAGSGAAIAIFEGFVGVSFEDCESGRKAEQKCGENGDECGEEQDGRIDVYEIEARKVVRAESYEAADAEFGEQQA